MSEAALRGAEAAQATDSPRHPQAQRLRSMAYDRSVRVNAPILSVHWLQSEQ